MAVTIGTELVNNGNSGWTNADVMTALEKVFYDMGYNSGSQEDGVPIAVLHPGYDLSQGVNFARCIRYHYETTPTPDGDDRIIMIFSPSCNILILNYSLSRLIFNKFNSIAHC